MHTADELPVIRVADLGQADYLASWKLQESLLYEATEIKLFNRERPASEHRPMPHYLLLCEHNPVFTLGKSAHPENILTDEKTLAKLGIQVHRINRGGDVTYHGPGQLTGYPILDLEFFFTDLHKYMRMLEEVMIRMLSDFGLKAGRIPGLTGVWMDGDKPYQARKICAFGVHMSRWITLHGFGLNVNPRLDMFQHIVPCGIQDKGVTSMAWELGYDPGMDRVKESVVHHFGKVFKARMENLESGKLEWFKSQTRLSTAKPEAAAPDAAPA